MHGGVGGKAWGGVCYMLPNSRPAAKLDMVEQKKEMVKRTSLY